MNHFIDNEISQLPPSELAEFHAWFQKFNAKVWNKQFEQDVKSGKLDKPANQAIEDFRNDKHI